MRWSEPWDGLVLPGLSIAGKDCDIQAYDGARMGADVGVHPCGKDWRTATDDGYARGGDCAALYRVERRRVADVAQMLSAGVDGTALFPCVAEHWIVRDDQQ